MARIWPKSKRMPRPYSVSSYYQRQITQHLIGWAIIYSPNQIIFDSEKFY